jgi:formylglycine-generating enzyme
MAGKWRRTRSAPGPPFQGLPAKPYLFGAGPRQIPIEIRDFYMLVTPVTQELWTCVMGSNPSARPAPRHPVENVSWDQITRPGGFLERINASEILPALAGTDLALRFRLPSESEWEYAARGGPNWQDQFKFSGSNEIDKVAWYGPRFSGARRLICRVLGWRLGWRLTGRFPRRRPTHTHEVALKAPNQLGLYDLCGNVWEWCQDTCTDDLDAVPRDGKPWCGPGSQRRLRGGCHHNWNIHCMVWFRYGITSDAHDGCIGFRLVLAAG